uniref:WW domain-containing protein n=1 Tax=Globisporangium ultimum (strain ATCC 200006 / CBS 805.95 / DAOM BR144) TaxID=431595 RepID=K3X873_GLOUD
MVARGVNGASSVTLNERFIKCAGCKVNVPKDDMIALGKCTVCGRAYEPVVLDGGNAIAVEFVAFETNSSSSSSTSATTSAAAEGNVAKQDLPRRKRWAELTSRKGRTYYHNTETGEDRWDKPADFDADAVDDAFVPFKNDFVKQAVMLEQTKLEASKLGVPLELVAAAHQTQIQEQDPLSKMTQRALDNAEKEAKVPKQQTKKAPIPAVEEENGEEEEEFDGDAGDGGHDAKGDGSK